MIQECRMMQEEIVKLRRDLHRIPELGCVLPETCAYVEARLKELGIPCRQIAENGGILAEIDTGKPGKTLLLRADMDALPVPEETGHGAETSTRREPCGWKCSGMPRSWRCCCVHKMFTKIISTRY